MRKNKKQRRVLFLLILILGITIGFALLSVTLKINGTAGIKSNTWNIHWDDTSVNVVTGSVEATNPVVSTTTSTKDTVSFNVDLELPGDYFEFEVDAINEGSIDGAIQLDENFITYKKDNVVINNLPNYLKFSVKYDDNTTPQDGDVLKANNSKTYKIRVEYDSQSEYLPSTDEDYEIEISIPYIQYKEYIPAPDSFSTDSWETIQKAVQDDNLDAYDVGDTKEVEIDLDNDGTAETTAHLRIANLSTPQECSQEGFSQTACGLVIEFVEAIDSHRMNPYVWGDHDTLGNGNIGSWEYSEMRTYINNNIYNALPNNLKNKIINTLVVSGHNSLEPNNYICTDKLYLFSPKEVWGKEGTSSVINYDTAEVETRQLDYYRIQGVMTDNGEAAVKFYGPDNSTNWWLRTASSHYDYSFFSVSVHGYWEDAHDSSTVMGVSPAFRIG